MACVEFYTLSADMVVVKKSSWQPDPMKDGMEVKRYWIALGPAPQKDKSSVRGISVPRKVAIPSTVRRATPVSTRPFTSTTQIWTTSSAPTSCVNPGGMIMIHGQRNSLGSRVQPSNWTNGCIAVLNHEMDEIWNAIEPGTPSSSSPDRPPTPASCGRVAVADHDVTRLLRRASFSGSHWL